MSQVEILVRAGASYDEPGQRVNVNEKPVAFETSFGPVEASVNIKGYKLGGQPVPGAYFDERSDVNFSIVFKFTPNKDISGDKLLWGNDFDTPIRDLLPWGFSAAFAAFKRLVDPSVDGDVYADKPYLYGPCLTSINYISPPPGPGSTPADPAEADQIPADASEKHESLAEAKQRQKKFLDSAERAKVVFKAGQPYSFEFCTPFLELSTQLAVKLPGFTFDVGKYAGKTELRFVLRANDELVFKVTFDVPEASKTSATETETTTEAQTSTSDPNDMDQVD